MRGTTSGDSIGNHTTGISIHVPHAGDDGGNIALDYLFNYFNPRPPCGGRLVEQTAEDLAHVFQSTSPMRGTTHNRVEELTRLKISIHVPHAGDDGATGLELAVPLNFNPRPPCGGRPNLRPCTGNSRDISIHVPHAGDDSEWLCVGRWHRHFNPRPPCGGRRSIGQSFGVGRDFNPRPPCGGRPDPSLSRFITMPFQSTSPMRGTTSSCRLRRHRQGYFNPRPPCGGRLGSWRNSLPEMRFQSTSPMRGTT